MKPRGAKGVRYGRLRNIRYKAPKTRQCQYSRQPFPESVSEEGKIYTDYDGCHRHRVKQDAYLSVHFSRHSPNDGLKTQAGVDLPCMGFDQISRDSLRLTA